MRKFGLFEYILVSVPLVSVSSAFADSSKNKDSGVETLTPVIVTPKQSSGYTNNYASNSTGLQLSQKHTPKSITTITEEYIKDNQLESVTDIIEDTPGISVDKQDGDTVIYFSRGFEIESYQVDGMAVDFLANMPMGDANESSAIFEKVEVVRGSNGLMKGAGKPSASINLIRKKADTFDFKGSASLYTSHLDNIGATIDLGSKLNSSGTLRGRLIIDGDKGGTHLNRENKKRKVFYGVLEGDLTDNTTMSVGARFRENTRNSSMSGALPAFYADRTETNWSVSKSSGVDWQKSKTESKELFAKINHNFGNDWKLNIQGNAIKNNAKSKSFFINDYSYKDPNKKMRYSASNSERESSQKNINAQLSGEFSLLGRNHKAMIGAQYSTYDMKNYSFSIIGSKAKAKDFDNWNGTLAEPKWAKDRQLNYHTKMTEKAINGSVKFNLTDSLSALAGGRLTKYDIEHTYIARFGSRSFENTITSQYDNVFTPFVGLTYDIDDNFTAFASYTDIFEPQYLLDRHSQLLNPIEGKNTEVGIKYSNNDESLQGQLSFFYIKQDNLAKKDEGYTVPGTTDFAYIGTKGTVSKGFDFEISGNITPQWRALLGYTQFSVKDNKGERHNPEEPQRMLKIFTTYDMDNKIPGLTIGGGLKWYGDRYTTARLKKPGAPWYAKKEEVKYDLSDYAVVDIMAKYKINKKSSLQINVNNLFNKKYKKSQHSNNFNYGEPLNVMARFSYQF